MAEPLTYEQAAQMVADTITEIGALRHEDTAERCPICELMSSLVSVIQEDGRRRG